jgi:alkanesulfonate monooxygenase SsuD/methylene tetrahydromethanopterin reductase-like flavin-dependent oxidoreductase (luciferase family)
VLPWGDAATAAELAVVAEESGWDGFFMWEAVWGIDPWVGLTAVAARTKRLRIGTMLTPLPRRPPWDLASESATLDNFSGGRLTLSVGLGAPDDRFWMFEEDPGRKIRAERLDEGLELLTHLWRAEPFTYEGRHYQARWSDFMVPPPALQKPRIPVWVVGQWGASRSMRRVARWDGWLPNFKPPADAPAGELNHPTHEALAEGVAWLREERAAQGLDMAGFDVVMEGTTEPGAEATDTVRGWADAGATWWLEANWSLSPDDVVAACTDRLRAGPPKP